MGSPESRKSLVNGYPCEIIMVDEAVGRFDGIPYEQHLTGFEVVDVNAGTAEFFPKPLPTTQPE